MTIRGGRDPPDPEDIDGVIYRKRGRKMPRAEKLITHNLDYIEYTCSQVRIHGRSAKLEEAKYYLTAKPRSKADALQELQTQNKTISVKIISIRKQERKSGLFGMTESEYLELSHPMETRTKFSTKSNIKEIKEDEENN